MTARALGRLVHRNMDRIATLQRRDLVSELRKQNEALEHAIASLAGSPGSLTEWRNLHRMPPHHFRRARTG